jgi:hypothetical protein
MGRAADMTGVTVALLVAVFAFFHDVGLTTMVVRAGVAGVGVAALARLGAWSISYMLNHSSPELELAPRAADRGAHATHDITTSARTRREGE